LVTSLFESIRPPTVAERARECAFPPTLAYGLWLLFTTILPFLGRVPAWSFRAFGVLMLLCGGVGLVLTLRLGWIERRALDWRGSMWLIIATGIAVISLETGWGLAFLAD
jgi:hypothetical protein